MTSGQALDWIKSHRWWVALVIVLIAGYSFGKDMALRDNARTAWAEVSR